MTVQSTLGEKYFMKPIMSPVSTCLKMEATSSLERCDCAIVTRSKQCCCASWTHLPNSTSRCMTSSVPLSNSQSQICNFTSTLPNLNPQHNVRPPRQIRERRRNRPKRRECDSPNSPPTSYLTPITPEHPQSTARTRNGTRAAQRAQGYDLEADSYLRGSG